MDNYFTGDWTDENIRLLAKYQQFEVSADLNPYDEDISQLKSDIASEGNVGDTELKKIYENERSFVYLSIDSGIEVVNVIVKESLAIANQ